MKIKDLLKRIWSVAYCACRPVRNHSTRQQFLHNPSYQIAYHHSCRVIRVLLDYNATQQTRRRNPAFRDWDNSSIFCNLPHRMGHFSL